MIKNDLYYSGSTFTIGNKEYGTYMCVGQRGRGKTTYWIDCAGRRALKEQISSENQLLNETQYYKHKFVFVRREEEQMRKVLINGIFETCKTAKTYRKFWSKYRDTYKENKIYVENTETSKKYHIGYYYDLNTVKGVMVEDADVLIFDEIIELDRAKYKGGCGGANEPDRLAKLDETLFRRRDNWFILLGNDDSPTDPYREDFGVPYGATTFRNKERGIFYEFDVSSATTQEKLKTSTGRRWKNTEYSKYSNGEISMGEVDKLLICDKPKHSKLIFQVKVSGNLLSVWQDENTAINYVVDDCKVNPQMPIYSVTKDDMSVNTLFVAFNSGFIQMQKVRYGQGMYRFNSQKTATLFMIMLKLI